MSNQAFLAIKAAKGYISWGPYAARRFATNNGVHPKLIRIARQLENEVNHGIK